MTVYTDVFPPYIISLQQHITYNQMSANDTHVEVNNIPFSTIVKNTIHMLSSAYDMDMFWKA